MIIGTIFGRLFHVRYEDSIAHITGRGYNHKMIKKEVEEHIDCLTYIIEDVVDVEIEYDDRSDTKKLSGQCLKREIHPLGTKGFNIWDGDKWTYIKRKHLHYLKWGVKINNEWDTKQRRGEWIV